MVTEIVFAFGDEQAVTAAVQRPETHICIDSGASRSACPFCHAPVVTERGTAPPMFLIDGASIEQRGTRACHGRNETRLENRSGIGPLWLGEVCCSLVQVFQARRTT